MFGRMRKLCLLQLLAVFAAILNTQAFNYQDSDVLLVFRKDGANDVLFNLGSAAQLTGVPSGQTVAVPGYNSALVKSTYGVTDTGELESDIRFAVVASTRPDAAQKMAWLSCSEDAVTPLDRTASQWQSLWSKINAVGVKAMQFTQTNSTTTYTVEPSHFSSYSTVINISAPAAAPKLGGASAFVVEGVIPAKVRWFEVKPSTLGTKPNARQVGYFTFSADGALKFTAGVEGGVTDPIVQAPAKSVVVATGRATVAFDGKAGTSYRLRYSSNIALPLSQWTVGSSLVTGANASATLSESASDPARFFVIEAFRP